MTAKKQVEMDQTSASASKPKPSQPAVILDLSPARPQTTSYVEEVEYGSALPPRLSVDHHNASDQLSSPFEEPSKVLDRPKKHSYKRQEADPRSASDQYYYESDDL